MTHEAVLILLTGACAIGIVIGGGTLFQLWQCTATGKQMRVEHAYFVPAGCMVKTKRGQWVPLSAYRVNE